jgi:hypothetical protein
MGRREGASKVPRQGRLRLYLKLLDKPEKLDIRIL